MLQKNLKDILNFKLSQEEIYDIINNRNRYNIVLLLYRIKNSYYKYKIHFSDIMVFVNPMKQNDLNEKAKILLEPSNNNEIKKNDENEDIFPEEDETIKNPKKIKIQKLSLIKKNSSLTKEKTYMNKIILPKIQKDSKNYRNQNFENNTINIQENYKFDKIPLLNKNKSEINIFKPTPLSLDENRKKPLKFIVKNKKRFDLTKELLKGKNPVNNIFQRRINIIKLKGLNTDKAHNASEPEFNFIKKDKRFMNKILDKLSSEKNGYYFQEKNFSLFNIAENSKYNTALKRQEYSTILKNENEKRVVIKRLNHFNQFFYKLEMSQKQRKNYSYSTDLKNKLNSSETQQFN